MIPVGVVLFVLTLLGLQSRFGDNLGQTTWNLRGVSPKRDWSSKRVNSIPLSHMEPDLRVKKKSLRMQHIYSLKLPSQEYLYFAEVPASGSQTPERLHFF